MAKLSGLRLLVVEDELMVAMMLEDALRSAGCIVVGPVPRVERAVEVAQKAAVDAALLDVNLAGRPVYPVVELLTARRIPFLLMTGYGSGDLPADLAKHPIIAKPFKVGDLLRAISALPAS